MTELVDDLDRLASLGGYDDSDAVLEDAIDSLLRRRPGLRRSLAVEKYRSGEVSLNRAAEIAGDSVEEFKSELDDRGITRRGSFLDQSERQSQLDALDN